MSSAEVSARLERRMIATHQSFEIVYIREFYDLSEHDYKFPYEKMLRKKLEGGGGGLNMADEITSIAELKKKFADAITDKNMGWAYAQVLKFEANVRGRIKELGKPYPFCGDVDHKDEKIKELRRILGEEIKGDEKSG